MAETRSGVVTLGELEIGTQFEFGTIDKLRAGDLVDICKNVRFSPAYGKARITKVLPGGFYEARRIN
jgi:hypothetical protein